MNLNNCDAISRSGVFPPPLSSLSPGPAKRRRREMRCYHFTGLISSLSGSEIPPRWFSTKFSLLRDILGDVVEIELSRASHSRNFCGGAFRRRRKNAMMRGAKFARETSLSTVSIPLGDRSEFFGSLDPCRAFTSGSLMRRIGEDTSPLTKCATAYLRKSSPG